MSKGNSNSVLFIQSLTKASGPRQKYVLKKSLIVCSSRNSIKQNQLYIVSTDDT